jgi:PhnB protein
MTESNPMPAVAIKGGAVPYLSIEGAAQAAAFYQKAFGAELAMMIPPDEKGRTMHAHLYINGSSVMVSDFYPEHGYGPEPAQAFNILLPVTDVDAWFSRAVEAGATAVLAPTDMFWGDRYGQVRDPFGVLWAFSAPIAKGA